MKMVKKSIISFVLALVMIAMPIGDTYTLTPAYADTTVYVTRTGSKYHTHKCGNGTYYASSLSSALARGLTACKNQGKSAWKDIHMQGCCCKASG